MQNALKSNESSRIWFLQILKIEIQKGGQNNTTVLRNWFPPRNYVPPLEFEEILKI